MAFYYVPAPAKRSAIIRDWVVMALCRPLFPELILHWHAYGLGEWVVVGKDWQRKLTRWALGKADLSIVLNNYNKRDAAVFESKRIEIVPNGIADQFPDYETALAPKREARAATLRALQEPAARVGRWEGEKVEEGEKACEGGNRAERDRLEGRDSREAGSPAGEINVGRLEGEGAEETRRAEELERVRFLFLGHLIESKGVFVAIEATALANAQLRKAAAVSRAHLTLAGSFASEEERARVLAAIDKANKGIRDEGPCVTLVGFLDSGQKKSALEKADCLVFPTFYENEAQPLVLLEAMSAGLPMITTSWRGVGEGLPEAYPYIIEPKSSLSLTGAMVRIHQSDWHSKLRLRYADGFTINAHVSRVADAIGMNS
jgi:glycosyltransferase involved in cell wall biosynthesis